ncbi:serine/threonine-protein kinase [Rhodopirellula sp. P2]|uniref:serine/threonine-protein kinase n=1 Tax=Rhodopirellula sp. P2 TaxID=2127060 RepID=UPI00236846BC|nr:serine/threonine-protein kinase [Rhodopirellula sp. P2]WDQ15842.1 protein kinase [Rhodopirellula sp. P2]
MPSPSEDPTEVRTSASEESCVNHIGEYKIVRTLGTGGMGEVYLAQHTTTQQSVALKMLRHHVANQQRFRRRFQREAQLIQGLDHEHIVPLLETGEESGVPFLAMRLIEGKTLADLILELKGIEQSMAVEDASQLETAVMTPTQAESDDQATNFQSIANLIADIADALHFAHSQKIIHRDVKPSNLMLDRDGKIWLTDFGLAFLEDEQTALTMTGDLVGTPAYMSPEQTLGSHSEVTRRSDVYSLGATLYEWATLHRPFSGNREQVLVNVAQGSLATPRSLRADLPLALEAVICKAMSRSPEARYPSAAAFADDLRRFANGKPVLAKMPGWTERLFRWSQRNPLVALASFIGVITTVVAVLGMQAIYSGQLVRINEQLAKSNDDLITSNLQLEAREAELSNQLFISDMSLAFQAFAAKNLITTKQLLDKHREESVPFGSRRFALELLDYLATPPSSVLLTKHQAAATAVAVSEDGKLVVSASEDGEVHVVDLETKQLLHKYSLPGRLDSIAISPDKQFFLTGLNESIGFTPIKMHRVDNGEEVLGLLGHWHSMESGTFSSDGKWIATADRYRQIQVHDTDGNVIDSFDAQSRNESLCFLEDSHRLVYVQKSQAGHEVRVRDLDTEDETVIPTDVMTAQFAIAHPRGKSNPFRIVTQGYGSLSVSDSDQSAPFVKVNHFNAVFRCVAISRDGEMIYSGTDEGSVYVWRLKDRDVYNQLFRPLLVPAANGRIYEIATVPEESEMPRFVTSAEDGNVILWDTQEKMPIRPSHPKVPYPWTSVLKLATPHHGSSDVFLRMSGGAVVHYNPQTELRGLSVVAHQPIRGTDDIAVTEDASTIAVATDTELSVYDVESRRLIKTIPSPDLEKSCRGLHYLGQRLYVLYTEEVLVYDLPDYSLAGTITLPVDNANSLTRIPSEDALLVVTERALCKLEGMSASLFENAGSAADYFDRVVFDSRGKQMAIIRLNRLVEIRSFPEGETLAVLRGHIRHPSDCSFMDNDMTVATTSEEGLVRFWDIASEREMGSLLTGTHDSNCLHYFKEADMLLATSAAAPMELWVTDRSQAKLSPHLRTEEK